MCIDSMNHTKTTDNNNTGWVHSSTSQHSDCSYYLSMRVYMYFKSDIPSIELNFWQIFSQSESYIWPSDTKRRYLNYTWWLSLNKYSKTCPDQIHMVITACSESEGAGWVCHTWNTPRATPSPWPPAQPHPLGGTYLHSCSTSLRNKGDEWSQVEVLELESSCLWLMSA